MYMYYIKFMHLSHNSEQSYQIEKNLIKFSSFRVCWKKGYIKQPPTFLNNESWEDDLEGYGKAGQQSGLLLTNTEKYDSVQRQAVDAKEV